VGLTDDQANAVVRLIDGPTAAGPNIPANLRYLLNAWDPIGVARTVSDEYDCLIDPLHSRLSVGTSQAEISDFLRHELADHFGLDPAHTDTDAVADQLIAWWARRKDS